ncbi:hypothetical protein D3C85_1149020 [compost metagenome]
MAGQASAQALQRMQACSGPGGGSSARVGESRQLVALTTGTMAWGRVKPIMGPPMMTR